jgi:hypothetical protein
MMLNTRGLWKLGTIPVDWVYSGTSFQRFATGSEFWLTLRLSEAQRWRWSVYNIYHNSSIFNFTFTVYLDLRVNSYITCLSSALRTRLGLVIPLFAVGWPIIGWSTLVWPFLIRQPCVASTVSVEVRKRSSTSVELGTSSVLQTSGIWKHILCKR